MSQAVDVAPSEREIERLSEVVTGGVSLFAGRLQTAEMREEIAQTLSPLLAAALGRAVAVKIDTTPAEIDLGYVAVCVPYSKKTNLRFVVGDLLALL